MYVEREAEMAMPPRMHITGARTSIRRTITPWKATTKIYARYAFCKRFTVTHSKVDRGDSIQDDEDVVVRESGKAVVDPSREEHGEDLKVEEEGGPGRGLVLGDGGDDGDVVLGVRGVKQRVEATGPWGNFAYTRGSKR